MKKILISLILLTLLVTPVSTFAYGENSSYGDTTYEENTSNARSTVKGKIQTRIENVKTKVTERIENKEENKDERMIEFAKKHSERILKRFTIYYERLSGLISKIEAKLGDNSKAKIKLNEAKTKLEEAKKLGDEAVVLFSTLNTANLGSNSEAVENAKSKANEARFLFHDTLKTIKEVVKIVKVNNNVQK